MKKSKELRAIARESLRGQWLTGIVLLLLESILVSVASGFGVSFLVAGSLSAGVAYCFITCVRDRKPMDVADLFRPFGNEYFVTTLLAGLLSGLLVALASLLLVVPGVILSYSYRLVPYLAAERQDLTATECLKESRRLMQGYKWRAFCLDLSFIGWLLLGTLACGIGVIFVAPYMQAASAAFAAERMALEAAPTIDVE